MIKNTKIVFVFNRGFARTPTGGAYDAALDSLVGQGGVPYPLSILCPFGASVRAPNHTKLWLRYCRATVVERVQYTLVTLVVMLRRQYYSNYNNLKTACKTFSEQFICSFLDA